MSKSVPIALGFKAGRGGSVVVGVAKDDAAPRVVLNLFLATAEEGDRLAREPYQVAYEMAHGAHEATVKVKAAVAEGRKRQDRLAAKHLDEIIRQMQEAGFKPKIAALLINRAGWMTDLLAHALSAPEHPAVMEGLGVRDALRSAFKQCGVAVAEMDEKSLAVDASGKLRLSIAAIEARLKGAGATAGKPWRKEQKQACLAAWLALAGHK